MSKFSLDHPLSASESLLHLRPTAANHHLLNQDDDTSDRPNLGLDLLSPDRPGACDHATSDGKGPFHSVSPTVVLYSSDISNPTVHGTPHVVGEVGGGSASQHNGTTSSGGSTLVTGAASTGLVINVTYNSTAANAPAGFKDVIAQVVQYYENHFTDPATINITVGYGSAGGYSLGGALGMSLTYLQSTSYSQIKSALTTDAKTSDDTSAVASLVSDPTNGSGHYWVSTAEAKALGLNTSTTSTDGFVGFSSSAGIFDYNNVDGVAAGQYDFFGVVAHEFSEVMGRMLLVGGTIGSTSNSYDALDLFHFSSPGAHDLSGTVAGYFSVDNGTTNLHNFNVSASGGDRGDWASSATPNSFDAFGKPGVVEPISSSDLKALDAIGWDAASSGNPPPPPPNQPDLGVSILSLHDTTLSLQFTNTGAGATAASTAGLYLSTDGTITTADILIGTIAIPTLAAGGSVSGNVTVPFPSNLAAGTYHLGVIADYNSQIAESNESNNTAVASTTIILGNSGHNTLTGTANAEEIIALGSSDTLIGNGGVDTLIGGSGSDHFRYNATTDGGGPGGPGDTIVDFTPGSDTLDFAHTAFGFANTGTVSSSNFVVNTTGATNSAQKFWFNTANFTLYYDADGSGSGAAVAMAQLENHAVLSSSSIHLV